MEISKEQREKIRKELMNKYEKNLIMESQVYAV